jgi:hypothetical protein
LVCHQHHHFCDLVNAPGQSGYPAILSAANRQHSHPIILSSPNSRQVSHADRRHRCVGHRRPDARCHFVCQASSHRRLAQRSRLCPPRTYGAPAAFLSLHLFFFVLVHQPLDVLFPTLSPIRSAEQGLRSPERSTAPPLARQEDMVSNRATLLGPPRRHSRRLPGTLRPRWRG